ncbi:MAG: threonine-phosphate decarboxylase CobD [Halanaerobiales bacterium]|nr:threonine-phosphate decarboxylase CobD [Halanaerobiales bacterium]
MEQIHGGNIEEVITKYNIKQSEVIDFSSNINFLGPPQKVLDKIKKELKDIDRYPEQNSEKLRCLFSEKFGKKKDNYIIGNGAVELIYILVNYLNPTKSLLLAPTFSEYEKALNTVNSKVEYHYLEKENNFNLDIEKLKKDLTDDIDLFFLCNPNNPTGNYILKNEILDILEHNSKNDVFTVIDEAFVEFIDQDISALELVNRYDDLFVLRSLTKLYGLPGLRLGYGVGSQEIIEAMNCYKDPWNVNILAQKAGEVLINQDQYKIKSLKELDKEKQYLFEKLKQINSLNVYYPNANYLFIDLSSSKFNGTKLYEKLIRDSILIRKLNNYKGLDDNYIRIAIKDRKSNLKLLKVINKIFTNN